MTKIPPARTTRQVGGPGSGIAVAAPAGSRKLGDRKRHSASIIVWARITGGEHLFVPHPLGDQQPAPVRNAWRLSGYAMAARFRDGCTRAYDIDLDRLLTAYGTWLAHRIDATGTAVHKDGPNSSTDRCHQAARMIGPRSFAHRPTLPRR